MIPLIIIPNMMLPRLGTANKTVHIVAGLSIVLHGSIETVIVPATVLCIENKRE